MTDIIPGKLYKVAASRFAKDNGYTVAGYRTNLRSEGPAIVRIPVGDVVLAVRFPEANEVAYEKWEHRYDWIVALYKEQLWVLSVRFLDRVWVNENQEEVLPLP